MLPTAFSDKLSNTLENARDEFKTLFFLFRREKVFHYLIFIMLLALIAGLLFLSVEYQQVAAAHPFPGTASSWDKLITSMYWSVVTIAACGYGDVTPATNAGRLLVMATLFLSLAMVSMFTANMASALTTKKMMERRGVMDLSGSRGHYIFCGWKLAIDKLLDEIVFNNPGIQLKKIIIIAAIEPEDIEVFRQQFPAYQAVIILRGEHYQENLLRKANAGQAAQIFILADESVPTASRTEIDSKTVMTAMTIRTLSPDVRICAELLDVKFEKYLRTAHVDDIIYTGEYSKVLIANAFSQVGMAKVVNDLLSAHTPAFIRTEKIPTKFVGKSFAELRDHYRGEARAILIGLVENAGSLRERKQEAVREAQKTADIEKLVHNLQSAKRLENNHPHLNPEDNFTIPTNSLAVLVRTRTA